MISSFPSISAKATVPALSVIIRGLATAVPPFSSSQENTLQFITEHFQVQERTKQLYKKTLRNKSIEKRHLALESMEEVLDQNLDHKNTRFEKMAVELSTRSLKMALANAGLAPGQLDFLAVATCTGYLCPGLSAYLVESCSLKPTIRLADLVGMGCGAALPAMEQAHNFLIAHPGATAAVVCTEICSAAMVSTDDIDIVISNTIFADGSAALILQDDGGIIRTGSKAWPRIRAFSSQIIPEWRDTLRFKSKDGHLKNVLGKDVPEQAAEALRRVSRDLIEQSNLEAEQINHWILHAGGEKILNALEASLNLAPERLISSREVLRNFGNMSSPTALFVLKEEIRCRQPQPGEWGILGSFGAGFSAHGALIEWI